MRAIASYDPAVPGRSVQLRVEATIPGGATTDISDAISRLSVTDTLERSPSKASVEISRGPQAWTDPLGGRSSPMAAGNRLKIEMGERGGAWVTVFEGEVLEGGTSASMPSARATLEAVGGQRRWWDLPITSPVYEAVTPQAIITDLFERYGGLEAGDISLPALAVEIAYLQVLERPIMDVAFDLLEPQGYIPWWNPETLRLETLIATLKIAPDVELAGVLRDSIDLSWPAPDQTRTTLQAGSLRDQARVEIGAWTFPLDPASRAQPPEGVNWARGSKADTIPPGGAGVDCFWGLPDGSGLHVGWGIAGDWLWVPMSGDWKAIAGAGGWGYRGPEGVRFLYNDPLESTEPTSMVLFTEVYPQEGPDIPPPDPDAAYHGRTAMPSDPLWPYGGNEEWIEGENRHVGVVWIGIDLTHIYAAGVHWSPIIFPSPEAAWNEFWGGDSNGAIDFEVYGRQVSLDIMEQLHSQAWTPADVAKFGSRGSAATNDTLALVTDPYNAVEAEVQRLHALAEAARYPARVPLQGHDLRLLPGDCVEAPHPEDDYELIVWLRSVTHGWEKGKGATGLDGWVTDTT